MSWWLVVCWSRVVLLCWHVCVWYMWHVSLVMLLIIMRKLIFLLLIPNNNWWVVAQYGVVWYDVMMTWCDMMMYLFIFHIWQHKFWHRVPEVNPYTLVLQHGQTLRLDSLKHKHKDGGQHTSCMISYVIINYMYTSHEMCWSTTIIRMYMPWMIVACVALLHHVIACICFSSSSWSWCSCCCTKRL